MLLSELLGRQTEAVFKTEAEVALGVKTAFFSHLNKRQVARSQQGLSGGKPCANDKFIRRKVGNLGENAVKVRGS